MNAAPPARVDAERNRRTLLDAAARALALNPDASLAEVARIAGLARATLYRHFDSRESLLAALRDDALACAKEAVAGARIDEGSALEALHRVVTGIVSFGGRFRPLLMEGAARDPEFLRRREEAFGPVAEIIRRGQHAGEIRADVPVRWIVTALTALLAAAVSLNVDLPDSETADLVFGTLAFGVQDIHGRQN